jgi:hypothetical protein
LRENDSGIDLPSITWAFQFWPKFDGGHFQMAIFPYWQIQMLEFLLWIRYNAPSMHVHAVYPTIVTPNSTPNLHGKSPFLWSYITPSSHNPSIFLGDKPWSPPISEPPTRWRLASVSLGCHTSIWEPWGANNHLMGMYGNIANHMK